MQKNTRIIGQNAVTSYEHSVSSFDLVRQLEYVYVHLASFIIYQNNIVIFLLLYMLLLCFEKSTEI
jgi:hypothetical protein